MRKFIGEFVLVCLIVQMVILVQLDTRTSDAKSGAGPITAAPAPRYVQRSIAPVAVASWDGNETLTDERLREAELQSHTRVAEELSLQNVSLPVTEPAP
ncbi:hypothetical protein CA54_30320 [Symmachiella macrocystis]|uniref:Uncharacterized protein n=1 Tax=Symmachiella macrocystis TaxID=2527985 RepID=A0A5C6BTM5_9PLAN|nr:hypothetical protein [Symmachiella macrocystis]TWU14189.1 hypothetical protein CA54_30320 [Symmachiella macrocystis]